MPHNMLAQVAMPCFSSPRLNNSTSTHNWMSGITACKGNSGKLVTPQKDAVATITITCSPMLQQPNERMER